MTRGLLLQPYCNRYESSTFTLCTAWSCMLGLAAISDLVVLGGSKRDGVNRLGGHTDHLP